MPAALPRLCPDSSIKAPTSLLRPDRGAADIRDYDQWSRYGTAADWLDRLFTGIAEPIRVLEVGCNVLNLLPEFLDADRVRITRCDTHTNGDGDPDYVQVAPGQPLPFEDESFDAIVALEVLEHVPQSDRGGFVAECLRVARHAVIMSCPDGSPAVEAAEGLANAEFERRHGRPHPFLLEHRQFGLPRESEVRDILRGERLHEGQHEPAVQQELVRALRDLSDDAGPCYRKFYIGAKSYRAAAAVSDFNLAAPRARDPESESSPRSPGRRGESDFEFRISDVSCPVIAGALRDAIAAADRVIAAREFQHRTEPATLRAIIAEQQNGLDELGRCVAITSWYAQALEQSLFWRALAPLRWLRHQLRPRGFDARHLLPWRSVETVDAARGEWKSLDADPQLVAACWLPAGWARLRFRIQVPDRTHLEIYAEHNGGFCAETRLGQFALAAGDNEEEVFVHLDRPTRAIRVDPMGMPGYFRIERLEVLPRPAVVAVIDALRRKLRLLRAYRNTGPVLRRGLRLLLAGRWREVARKWTLGLHDPRCTRHGYVEPQKAYEKWMARRALTDADRASQRAWAEDLDDPPRISILMPVYNPPERFLRLAIESVTRQTYPHWELCIADDGSTAEHVRPMLEQFAAQDHRVKLTPPGRHGGISAATNAALALAEGDYVALLDHDDEIAEHALFRMAQAIVADRAADMLYSDEDKLQPDGLRVRPFFKPDWSPEFFLGCMFTCHLGLYRTDLVRAIGAFRPEFDGAQDYDMVLRLTERTDRIVHVPDVLYHWRLLPESTAAGVAAKPHAHAAGLRALQEHLERTGRTGRAEVGPAAGLNFVRFDVIGQPLVSIIVPSLCAPGAGGPSMLERCITSIVRGSRYRRFEILILDRRQMPPDMEKRLAQLGVQRVVYDDEFNWSRVNNLGVAQSAGEHLLFLNDDTEILTPDWLEAMLEFSQQPEIGAVGAKLLFPDGGLQHVGVTVLDGKPGHPFYGYPSQHTGYYCRSVLPHNCAAVTGACLMTRREVFDEIGGFDEAFPLNYNDVDYCMKARKLGYRIVFTPHARLLHHESVTKAGVFAEELDAFRARWGDEPDPYYNPNLNPETFDYRIGE